MIRIQVHPHLLKRLKKLPPETVAGAESALARIQAGFGNPHLHSGLKITKLRNNLFECRIDLRYRILLLAKPGLLTAYDIMTHDPSSGRSDMVIAMGAG